MHKTLPLVVFLGLGTQYCAKSTAPGTHVELVNRDGTPTYVAGAAGPGTSQTVACRMAVQRAVAAIGERFAREHRRIARTVAREVGAKDGEVFLQRFARERAMGGAVQDTQFDPSRHLCMATLRWKSPIFVEEAVLQFAAELKERELAGEPSAEPETEPQPEVPAGQVSAAESPPAAPTSHTSPPPPPVAAAPAPAAPNNAPPAAPKPPSCKPQQQTLRSKRADARKALDQQQRCLSRSNEVACHRYGLLLERAQKAESSAALDLVRCFNGEFSSGQLQSLEQTLPGHAAVVVETTEHGHLVVWSFAPLEHTGFAVRMEPGGAIVEQTPLASNQLQWVRERLGL